MARTRAYRPAIDKRHENAVWADPNCKFLVTPAAGRLTLSVGGLELPTGTLLDKGKLTPRRLRQMYDARLIALAPGSTLPVGRGPRPRAIGPVDSTLSAKEMLEGTQRPRSGVLRRVPRRRAISGRRAAEEAAV